MRIEASIEVPHPSQRLSDDLLGLSRKATKALRVSQVMKRTLVHGRGRLPSLGLKILHRTLSMNPLGRP